MIAILDPVTVWRLVAALTDQEAEELARYAEQAGDDFAYAERTTEWLVVHTAKKCGVPS